MYNKTEIGLPISQLLNVGDDVPCTGKFFQNMIFLREIAEILSQIYRLTFPFLKRVSVNSIQKLNAGSNKKG